MKHKILSLVILVVLSSCVKLKKKDQDQQVAPEAAEVSVQQQEQPLPIENTEKENFKLSYEYKTDDAKSLTQVIFHFPTRWPSELVVERKNNGNNNSNQFGVETLKEHQWYDYLTSEDKISYKFYKKVYNQLELLDEVEVLPVLNLDVREDIDLAEKYSLNNKTKIIYIKYLRISSQARLFVQDYSGLIKIENLYSESGFLQTFPLGKRSTNQDGRSVGGFELQILSGEGDLNLYLVAESGADGENGKLPDENLPGALGANADSGVNGLTAQFSYSSTLDKTYFSCIKNPEDGHSGGRGKKGYPGHDGKNGGDVKPIQIVNNYSNLKINFYAIAGQKGNKGHGGLGGVGGPGGLGGDGAERDFLIFMNKNPEDSKNIGLWTSYGIDKKCLKANDGATGPQGESGPDGHDGLDGQIIKNSI